MPTLSRKKRVTLLLVGIAIFAWVAHSSYRVLSQQREEQSNSPVGPLLTTGMTLPTNLLLKSMDGESKTDFEKYRGKVILINFWAGWCPPCLHEMPDLYALHRRLESKGFVVLGINMDDKAEDGLRVLKQRVKGDAPFPLYHGMGTLLADRFAIDGLPFSVIVGRDLKIQYARAGEVNWKSDEVLKLIEGLL